MTSNRSINDWYAEEIHKCRPNGQGFSSRASSPERRSQSPEATPAASCTCQTKKEKNLGEKLLTQREQVIRTTGRER